MYDLLTLYSPRPLGFGLVSVRRLHRKKKGGGTRRTFMHFILKSDFKGNFILKNYWFRSTTFDVSKIHPLLS